MREQRLRKGKHLSNFPLYQCPDLNPEWGLLGSGEMYRQSASTSINMEEEHDPDDGASLFSSVTDGTDVFEGMNDIFGNVPSSSSPVRTQERHQQHKRTIVEKPEAPVQSLSDTDPMGGTV